jgi:FixJ family two-component response regulator
MDQNNTVCIVDDDEAVRDSMRVLVESYGHLVRDYPSAIAYLSDSGEPEPGCLLLDLHMPGMDGLELVEVLRRRQIQTPAIIVTGQRDSLQLQRVREAGVLALLNKPVTDQELISWIEQALGRDHMATH